MRSTTLMLIADHLVTTLKLGFILANLKDPNKFPLNDGLKNTVFYSRVLEMNLIEKVTFDRFSVEEIVLDCVIRCTSMFYG